ncbi:MarR family winged helix-turn-helix transcriptional regulator [Mycobacteroides salmoniphilum]|uniref:MarR family winged helix-turn-helix transcriptional regulator n=1 Tax=Mycobacteroides salmoniphilum TaxID=404941 RepID=UPI000992CB1E|nr:MarR family transcriptional regulator [Mycobacteroides salmoniphilum]QCH24269.1 Transcriptional regulator SlyA [Mycobacteroides salmoniphilum]
MVSADNSDPGAPLGYLLTRTTALLRRHATAGLEPLGLSLSAFICMQILHADPGSSNSQLARKARVSRQAMCDVLQQLQDEGLVTRPISAEQGRTLPASLTRKGLQRLDMARQEVTCAEHRVTVALTDEERGQLRLLLAQLSMPPDT